MSIRLTCSTCGKPDSRLAIVFDDIEEINNWLPYVCLECEEKSKELRSRQ